MSLSSLHAIELQLICQMLGRRTIVDLARCSKATLAAASSKFAFCFAEPVELCSLQLTSDPPKSLLRFALVRLMWVSPLLNPSVADAKADRADIERVQSCLNLAGLDARCRGLLDWSSVLLHDRFQALHELRLGQTSSDSTIAAAIGSMKQLRLLSLEHCDTRHAAPLFAAIAQLPHLTDLALRWPQQDRSDDCLLAGARSLRGCVRLQRLTLKYIDTDALELILHAGMADLVELTLIGSWMSLTLEDDWVAALDSLPALSTLALLATHDPDSMLNALCAALDPDGPLRVLCVQPAPERESYMHASSVVGMLESHPLLELIGLELWSVVEVSPRANGEDAVSQTQVRDEAFACTWMSAQEYDLRRMRRIYEEIVDLVPEEDQGRVRIVEEAVPKPHVSQVAEALRARFLKPIAPGK